VRHPQQLLHLRAITSTTRATRTRRSSPRELHTEIDEAVLAAYGWDLDLEIGHHPTKIGTRWTVSPRARFVLLDLLLEENHRRAALQPCRQRPLRP